LLGLSPEEAEDESWREQLLEEPVSEAKVMEADVLRSVCSWDVHTSIPEDVRDIKRAQLSEVMRAILTRHSGTLAYFQGFHDVVLVFLEVGSPSCAYHMVERLALFHISDQLCWPFDDGLLPLLGVLFNLLQMLDRPLANALAEAGCAEMHFAVPWVLSWFAHSLPRIQQVTRLFDCLLSSHPSALLYFCAALLIHHRDILLATERDMPEMVAAIQSLPLKDLEVDIWVESSRRLMTKVSPSWLLWRLGRRCKVPVTSPLRHYPHPWMAVEDEADEPPLHVDLLLMAPIYLHKSGQLKVRSTFPLSMRALQQRLVNLALGVIKVGTSGSVLVLALALALYTMGANDSNSRYFVGFPR